MPKSIELDKKKFFLQLFDLFEKELLTIFEYIAPIENNYHISGNRIHDLHLRICSKIENLAKFLCLDIDENF